MTLLLPLCFFASSPATAADEEVPAEEIVVWGDLFARWDDTRWMVTTEIGVPYDLTLMKDENLEFQTSEIQLKTVIGCSKEWKLGGHRYEVDCEIEDFAIQASIAEDRVNTEDIARARAVLDEIDAKLSGAKLQLQVADDGRVTNMALDGVPTNGLRQSEMQETLRQILSRVVVGFNLKLRKFNQLNEGKWHEYNSTLMTMPMPPEVGSGQGSSLVVHYLNPFQGQIVVQSIGKGLVQVPLPNVEPLSYTIDLIGVSIFDKNEGYMLERVWAIEGTTTASAMFSVGTYINNGRIWVLGTQDKPDCGPTRVVNGRKQVSPELPKWVPIDR
jgi:hypothetical protein